MTLASATHEFDVSVLVLGGVLVLGALLSGLARRSFLSLTAVFVLVGFVLGDGVTGAVHFSPRSAFVSDLAVVALIVILFRDGLEVDGEMLARHWRPPLRKLVLAMPLTAVIVAVAAHVLTSLTWTEAFLLGALLSPTDPVLSSSVVTNPRVPGPIRHSLNLESGLNDGLALPAVLAFAAALGGAGAGGFVWWRFVLENVGLGFVVGLVVGLLAGELLPRGEGLEEPSIPDHQKTLYALGVAFGAYGIAVRTPHGNGLIAVFVAAIVLGVRRADIRGHFAALAQTVVEVVKLGIFVVFGSLLTFGGLFADGWAAVGIVAVTLLVARPVAVFAALAGTGLDRSTKAFMSWFGPKGVATMTFSLLVLSDRIAAGERIFHLAALAVFCSILLHGFTDTPGVRWIAQRSVQTRPVGSARPSTAPAAGPVPGAADAPAPTHGRDARAEG